MSNFLYKYEVSIIININTIIMTELYMAIVVHYKIIYPDCDIDDGSCDIDLNNKGIFSTEKKAIDYIINILINYNYLNFENSIYDVSSKDDYYNLLKEKINTLAEFNELCHFDGDSDYDHELKYEITKLIVDN